MSINAIRLQNFMAFQDTGWLDLGDITLLFGRNSSGKSAIIRAIRLLKQSLNLENETEHLKFADGAGNDFGSFQTILNHRTQDDEEMENIIRFQFRCTLSPDARDILQPYLKEWRQVFGLSPFGIDETPDWLELSLGFADVNGARLIEIIISAPWIVDKNNATIFYAQDITAELARTQFDVDEQDEQLIFEDWYSNNSDWFLDSTFLFQASYEEQTQFQSIIVNFDLKPGFLPTFVESVEYSASTDQELSLVQSLLNDLVNTIRVFLQSVQYLGPLRPLPERYYTLKNRDFAVSQALAQFLTDYLISSDDIKEIDKWLNELDLASNVDKKGKRLFTDGKITLAKLQLYESQKSIKPINIADLGSGTNQVFPIIVQSILAQPDSLVIIEQPELHLHPAAQAELAEVFMLKANQGVRFILETHSESLFLRFRRRIAETTANIVPTEKERQKLDVTNLKVYFFHRDTDEENEKPFSSIAELAITQWGEYAQSPPTGFKNFFSSDLEELAKITEAKLKASKSSDKQ